MEKEISLDYNLVDITVTGHYTEAEEATRYGNDLAGQPGSSAEFEVEKITARDSEVNIYNLLKESYIKGISELCINIINK